MSDQVKRGPHGETIGIDGVELGAGGPRYCLGCGREFERLNNGACDECWRQWKQPNHRVLARLETVRQERDRAENLLERLLSTVDLRSAPESVKTELREVIRAKHARWRPDAA